MADNKLILTFDASALIKVYKRAMGDCWELVFDDEILEKEINLIGGIDIGENEE